MGRLKKLTQDQVDESIKMYERGLSLQPISEYMGVTRQSMWDLLSRRIKLRPRERYGKDNHFFRGGPKACDNSQNMVEYALRRGILKKPLACDECRVTPEPFSDGRTAIQSHHDDYNKPLDVRWFCQKCHHKWHEKNNPIEKIAS